MEPQELKQVVELINQRPRKSLDYQTPHEVTFPGHQDRCTSALNGPSYMAWSSRLYLPLFWRFDGLHDPYLSHAASKGKTRPRLTPIPLPAWEVDADLVILTHDHVDHFDEVTLRPMVETPETMFLGPSSCLEHWLEMGLPKERFLRLDQGESCNVAGLHLQALYAEHASGNRRDAVGIAMEMDGLKVYQTGDSQYTERLVENGAGMKPDLLTVPINERLGNMNHEEAAKFAQAVAPSVVIPTHYGMFGTNTADSQDFVNAARDLDLEAKVVLIKVGVPLELEPES